MRVLLDEFAAGRRSRWHEVLLTVDQSIPHQVQLGGRTIAVIILHSRTNQIEDWRPLVDAVLKPLKSLKPGQVIAVGLPT